MLCAGAESWLSEMGESQDSSVRSEGIYSGRVTVKKQCGNSSFRHHFVAWSDLRPPVLGPSVASGNARDYPDEARAPA